MQTPLEQAFEHYRQGRYQDANRVLSEALRAQPQDPRLWNLAGASAQALDKLDAAEQCYRRSVTVAPDFAEGHYNLGLLLQRRERLPEAIAAYREALRHAPRHAQALAHLGDALGKMDQAQEAARCCEQAIAIDPGYARAHHNLGRAYAQLGRFDEAHQAMRQAIALAPPQEQARYCMSLAYAKRFIADDPDLAPMEALAPAIDTLPPQARMHLHYALGKAYGDLGRHEASFSHLLAANREKRRTTQYDEALELAQLRRVQEVFTPALMTKHKNTGCPTPLPIFILGMPRSGSTLAEQILASHPQVYGAGECEEFRAVAEALRLPDGRRALFDGVAELAGKDFLQLGEAYLRRLSARAPQAPRIVDKTLNNFLYTGLIHLALPQARIIHCRRDAVDTCLSCFSHLFGGHLDFTYDLAELGRFWRAYDGLMAHWRRVLPPGVMLELQYEEVVEDLEGQARRLLDHCGLEWHEACLSFHQTERSVRTASLSQVRQPLYRSSVRKWQAYGELLRPLLDALGDTVPFHSPRSA
jgi:Flp pilus assembly protein TadD